MAQSKFDKLVAKLRAQGATDPEGLAAHIGRQKYGREAFSKMAAAGRKAKRQASKATEALIAGKLSYSDLCDLVRAAIQKQVNSALGDGGYCYVYVRDLTDTDAVYCAGDRDYWQVSYSVVTGVDGHNAVELGEPVEVAPSYVPIAQGEDVDPAGSLSEPVEDAIEGGVAGVAESHRDRIVGRVVEALGTDSETGGRVYRVQVLAYGDSKNGRRYPESVMREAVPLYEGAKAYDHHRSDAELMSSTISGLVGYYRNVEATDDGISADLYLLPSATHAAEALDASLAAQQEGLDPIVGISHDVQGLYRPVARGTVRVSEATAIVKVNSADIVANPAAGGKATRMVAGGIDPTAQPAGEEGEEKSMVDKGTVLAALESASAEELAKVGLVKATEAQQAGQPKDGFLGRVMIREAVREAKLPESTIEKITDALPDRITESLVQAQIASIKDVMSILDVKDLGPTVTSEVTRESHDKKVAALDAFFAGDYAKGYRSFREAFIDITGNRPRSWDEDFAKTILRESYGPLGGFDSHDKRARESLDSTSWSLVLGDSVTRRMVADYEQPSLQTWRQIVSSMPPINDFREQRIERVGGYGTLPEVAQKAPYQPLDSPDDEEVTYSISKRGGTEDITLEMIANDDIRAIQKIPAKLGLAAAQTLYRFVWDLFVDNAAVSYDSVALFNATHANTATDALSQTALSTARKAMRQQAAFGDTKDVLSIVPKFLVVPSALEELAFQLCTSAVAIPATPAGPTDTPNIHQGMTPLVIDYWDLATSWFTVANPSMVPTIEVGFYQGRDQPELFTQNDPASGSVFNADKITYKIRHIYGIAVLDHRGLYRGNVDA